MKKVIVSRPSFPNFKFNNLLKPKEKERWQVLCGDEKHWRLGIYSPKYAQESDITQLESHNCPELFVLLEGNMSLLLYHEDSKLFETLELKKGEPIMVDTWHDGFCPDGPFTGRALVIERDQFETLYKKREDF